MQSVLSLLTSLMLWCSVLSACTSCYPGQQANAKNLAMSCGPAGNSSCPSSQSTTYSIGNYYPASLANDGLYPPQNQQFTSTNGDAHPWWMVDFGSQQAVGSVTLYNRPYCCPTRLNGFQIWLGNNHTLNGDGNSMCYSSTPAADVSHNTPPFIQSFECIGIGRYVTPYSG